MTPILILLIVSVPLLWWGHRRRQAQQRELFIDEYEFPKPVLAKFRQHYPMLRDSDVALIVQGLRQFFHIHRRTHPLPIGMPSKAVDDLWHEFILDTRAYRSFCGTAFGHFFHHVPAGAVAAGEHVSQDLRRTWREACRLQGLSIATTASLPLLFTLDQALAIPNGNRFLPRASWVATGSAAAHSTSASSSTTSCGGVACSGGSASSSDSRASDSHRDSSDHSSNDSSSDSSGDSGGGDSGSSCGGGCGGGGGD